MSARAGAPEEAAGFADVIVWSLAKTPIALERIAEARELHQARH